MDAISEALHPHSLLSHLLDPPRKKVLCNTAYFRRYLIHSVGINYDVVTEKHVPQQNRAIDI